MQKGFHTNITFGRWFIGSSPSLFELIGDKKEIAELDLHLFDAHQYALLDAYPGNDKNLEEESKTNIKGILEAQKQLDPDSSVTWPHTTHIHDDYSNESSLPKSNPSRRYSSADSAGHPTSNADFGLVDTQVKKRHITWSPSSAIQYLVSRFYYSMALRVMEKDSSELWKIPLGISWLLYRTVDATRFVSALIFSPVGFALTFTLKNAAAATRLVGTWVHYGFASLVNTAADWWEGDISADTIRQGMLKANKSNVPKKGITAANFDDDGTIKPNPPASLAIETPNTLAAKNLAKKYNDKKSQVIESPCLVDAWTNFKKKFNTNWEDSTAYFKPVRQKLDPIIMPLVANSKNDRRWVPLTLFAGLMILGAIAFLDYVAVEVFTRAIENRPFGTEFLDNIGGGYAQLAWSNIGVGMKFFIHYLVNKAFVPALNFCFGFLGVDLAQTSPEVCRFVGEVFFMTLIPVLSALSYYKATQKSTAAKEKNAPMIIETPGDANQHNAPTNFIKNTPTHQTSSKLSCFGWCPEFFGAKKENGNLGSQSPW